MKKNSRRILVLALFSFFLGWIMLDISAAFFKNDDKSFIKKELAWRENRDKRMRLQTSWLNVAGLFWLVEGENSFGTNPLNKIKLPQGSAPSSAGKFIFYKGKITVVANQGVELKAQDKPITQKILKGDDSGRPDIIALNDLRMWVIKRGDQYAIRLRDLNALAYKNYKGLDFFPPSKKYKIIADFVPYPDPKKVTLDTIIGTETEMTSPGYVKFFIDGQEYSLEAFSGGSKSLFFIFKDETNGKETYEASRFMVSDVLDNGKVDLNFNRAYNPPCAYTPYATCPLPPPQNYLKVRIEAGEKKYPGSHH